MRKVNYKEKGITLIALVITIIILLILAGVTLTTALSQNGLFERAKYAGEKYKESEADEAEKLGEVEEEIGKIIDRETPLAPSLINVTESNLKEYQGKYVDIGLDTNDNNKVDDWEIFYATTDRIFLIAADYVPVSKLRDWGIIGDNGKLKDNGFQQNGEDEYIVNWSTPKDFLELPDLSVVMHEGYDLKSNSSNVNSIAVSHLLNKEAWEGIKNASSKSTSIDFVMGGPTLEMWCAAWAKAIEGNTYNFVPIEPDPKTDGYYVKYGSTSNYYLYVTGNISSAPSAENLAKYSTFFPHTSVESNCYGYWLASPSAYDSNSLMRVYSVGRVDRNYYDYNYLGVRPVVSLASGVQIVASDGSDNIYDLAE